MEPSLTLDEYVGSMAFNVLNTFLNTCEVQCPSCTNTFWGYDWTMDERNRIICVACAQFLREELPGGNA